MIPDGLPLSCVRACAGGVEHGGLARTSGARRCSSATRSPRCAGSATSTSSCSSSRPGRSPTRWPRARCAGASTAARLDIVHAHFGLTAWPALALRGPAPRGDAARHRRAPSALAAADARARCRTWISSRRSRSRSPTSSARSRRRRACCPAASRSNASARSRARPRGSRSGSTRDEPCLLFPADPERAEKRFDRALELAGGVRLLTLGATAPDHVTLAINAANAVLVPVRRRGIRPGGARGARLRRAGARHAGRRARAGAGRHRRHALRTL